MRLLLLTFLLAFSSAFYGQDALEQLELLERACRSNPDSAINELRQFYKHANDSIKGVSLNLTGNAFYFKSRYDSAIEYYLKSAEIFNSRNDELNLVKNYNNLGVCYFFITHYQKSFEYHMRSMKIRERLNDPKITSTYNNLGLVLKELESYDDALLYYKKALNTKIMYSQYSGLSTTLMNIASVYRETQNNDSAIYYDLKNLDHLDSIPDARNLALVQNNLGLSYLMNKEYDKAKRYFESSLSYKKQTDNQHALINGYINLAKVFYYKKQYKVAEAFLDSVNYYVRNPTRYRNAVDWYYQQYRNDSVQGNYNKAQQHLHRYVWALDSISKADKAEQLFELEKKYQAEKKEQQIAQLENKNKIQQLQAAREEQFRLFLIVAAILLIIAAGAIYYRYKSKAKTNLLLDAKNKELQKLNYTKDRLFSIISHDLKSPLSSFHTITKSLTDNWERIEKEQLKSFIENLRDTSKEVHDMMDNLLRWALNQTGQLNYNPTNINSKQIIEEVTKQLQTALDAQQLKVNMEFKSDAQIQADAEYLKIIIRNLLSNAIKFSEMGKAIDVVVEENEDGRIIAIRDYGVGMKGEDVVQILNNSGSVHDIKNSDKKGTGLGITLCKELMQKMGGTIKIESEVNKGSTFKLVFSKGSINQWTYSS